MHKILAQTTHLRKRATAPNGQCGMQAHMCELRLGSRTLQSWDTPILCVRSQTQTAARLKTCPERTPHSCTLQNAQHTYVNYEMTHPTEAARRDDIGMQECRRPDT